METCDQFRSFMAQRGMAGSVPEDAAAHLAQCPACRRLWNAYRHSVEQYREAGVGDRHLPDVGPVLTATRARLRRRALAAGAMAAAAVLAVVVGTATLTGDRPRESDSPATAGDPAPTTGARDGVLELTGSATLVGDDGTITPVVGTTTAVEGRMVRTESGEAQLADAKTARISMSPRTRLRVERWRPERSLLVLEEGRLEAQVQHRGPGEVFEVRTPLAVVRVVGTRFVVTHRPEGGTEIVGLEGEVTVEDLAGQWVARVTAGRSVRLGAPPAEAPGGEHPVEAAVHEAPRTAAGPREALEPVVPDALVTEARRLLADGKDGEALELLGKAVEASQPGDAARMLGALAEAYRLAGRPVEAAATWERSLSAGPGPAPESAYLGYADLLAGQDREAEAARVREAYVNAWPSGRHLGQALRELAAFAERDGRPQDAARLRQRLVQEAPRSREAVEVFVDLGLRMARGGDLAGAARWFEVRRDAESRELAEAAWVGLMRVRFEEGRFEEVRSLADQYGHRFPVGGRRDEVGRLVRALPAEPPRPR